MQYITEYYTLQTVQVQLLFLGGFFFARGVGQWGLRGEGLACFQEGVYLISKKV